MFKSHDFQIRINGTAYKLSTGFSFNRSMDMMGGAFSLDLIDPDKELISVFRPGVTSQIEINGKIIAKAIFDAVSIDDTNGTVFTYYGRDPSGDLVDCSAMFSDRSFQKKNIRLEAAIKDLLKPYGMGLKVAVSDTGKLFNEIAITPGETVSDVITRLCKYRALFPLSDGAGSIILTKAGSIRSGGHITVCGEDNNVITRRGTISHAQRYSEIKVKGGSNGNNGLEGWANSSPEDLSGKEGSAKDPDITRYRPLIIESESDGYDLDMKERALWEVRHRRFSGTEITYTLPGWEAAPGTLWKINTLVPVKDPQLFVDRDMIIKTVELSRDEDGTRTTLTVSPAESYDLPANREPKNDDALWGGGA